MGNYVVDTDKLKRLRRMNGYTLLDVSRILGGDSPNKAWNLENHKTRYSAEDLITLADFFKLDMRNLYKKKGS